jgi:hypothetical protein
MLWNLDLKKSTFVNSKLTKVLDFRDIFVTSISVHGGVLNSPPPDQELDALTKGLASLLSWSASQLASLNIMFGIRGLELGSSEIWDMFKLPLSVHYYFFRQSLEKQFVTLLNQTCRNVILPPPFPPPPLVPLIFPLPLNKTWQITAGFSLISVIALVITPGEAWWFGHGGLLGICITTPSCQAEVSHPVVAGHLYHHPIL